MAPKKKLIANKLESSLWISQRNQQQPPQELNEERNPGLYEQEPTVIKNLKWEIYGNVVQRD
ncbi:unnamed protein product, partial [Ilex paraguariensis]